MKVRLSSLANVSNAASRNENCVFQLFNKLAEAHGAINLVRFVVYVGRWHGIWSTTSFRFLGFEKICRLYSC
jgi:hypothetical protein